MSVSKLQSFVTDILVRGEAITFVANATNARLQSNPYEGEAVPIYHVRSTPSDACKATYSLSLAVRFEKAPKRNQQAT